MNSGLVGDRLRLLKNGANMIKAIASLLEEMHAETSYRMYSFSRVKCESYVEKLAKAGQFVYYRPGVVMLGTIETTFFGDDKIANDLLLFVSKGERGSGEASRAIESFCEWAESNGAKSIVIGQTTGAGKESFSALAQKFDFKEFGTVYRR